MDKSTQILLATSILIVVSFIAWRRYGFLAGLAVAVIGCWIAGAYVPAVQSVLLSIASLWEVPSSLIQNVAH